MAKPPNLRTIVKRLLSADNGPPAISWDSIVFEDNAVIQQDAYCPHCRRVTSQRLLRLEPRMAILTAPSGEQIEEPESTFIAACDACGNVLVYTELGDPLASEFASATLKYPLPYWMNRHVPEAIQDLYDQAVRLRTTSPSEYFAGALKAISAVCDDQDAPEGLVRDRLRGMADRGEIARVLADMAAVLFAQDPGDFGGANHLVFNQHTELMDRFVGLLVRHIYVMPGELQELSEDVFASRRARS